MTVFVDASALVAIIKGERDADALSAILERHAVRVISGVALWETARAVASSAHSRMADAMEEVERFRDALAINVVSIGGVEAAAAGDAHDRYGNGVHPAKLNMSDCFAYACAKTNGAALLYKGDDFSHTDLAR